MEADGLYRHTPSLSGDYVLRCISFDKALSKHVGDALTLLSQQREWVEVGDDIESVIDAARITVEDFYNQMLVGSVIAWLVDPPVGWLLLDGTSFLQADYPELSAVLPSHLKSGANFTLPDVDGAFPYGVLAEDDGSLVDGSNELTLTIAQLPVHTHNYIPSPLGVTPGLAGPAAPAAVPSAPVATTPAGSGDTIDTRPLRFGLIYAVFAGR